MTLALQFSTIFNELLSSLFIKAKEVLDSEVKNLFLHLYNYQNFYDNLNDHE